MPRRRISDFNRNPRHFTPELDSQVEDFVNKALDEIVKLERAYDRFLLSRFIKVGRELILYGFLSTSRQPIVSEESGLQHIWPVSESEIYSVRNNVMSLSDKNKRLNIRYADRNLTTLERTLQKSGYRHNDYLGVPKSNEEEAFANKLHETMFQILKDFSQAEYPMRPADLPTVVFEETPRFIIPGRTDVTFYIEECAGRPLRMKPKKRKPTPPNLKIVK